MYSLFQPTPKQPTWNKSKLVGQKPPLKLKEIWAIRIHLQIGKKHRDLALFNLAIESKLRASDLLRLRVSDISQGSQVASSVTVMKQKTGRPVQFGILSKPAKRCRTGFGARISVLRIICSRVGYISRSTFPQGSTLASSNPE